MRTIETLWGLLLLNLMAVFAIWQIRNLTRDIKESLGGIDNKLQMLIGMEIEARAKAKPERDGQAEEKYEGPLYPLVARQPLEPDAVEFTEHDPDTYRWLLRFGPWKKRRSAPDT